MTDINQYIRTCNYILLYYSRVKSWITKWTNSSKRFLIRIICQQVPGNSLKSPKSLEVEKVVKITISYIAAGKILTNQFFRFCGLNMVCKMIGSREHYIKADQVFKTLSQSVILYTCGLREAIFSNLRLYIY